MFTLSPVCVRFAALCVQRFFIFVLLVIEAKCIALALAKKKGDGGSVAKLIDVINKVVKAVPTMPIDNAIIVIRKK